MPKLNKKVSKKVDSAEATHGFGLIDPGKYFATLTEVRSDTTKDDNPMWVAEFSDLVHVTTGETPAGRQWWNLNIPLDSLPAKYSGDPKKFDQAQALAAGRLKAFFEAFGYEVDSDTDEMIGEKAVITVGVRTIQQGARTGEKANQVNDIESADAFGGAPEADAEEDEF